jgi:translation initiation factor IF-3
MKLNYAIGTNDLLLKIKKAREMLQDGYNVKFLIKLRGREKIFANKAIEKLDIVKNDLLDV